MYNNKYKHWKNIVLACLLLCLSNHTIFAQEQLSRTSQADYLFNKMEYASAVQLYQKLVDVKKPKPQHMERLADCYLYLNEYELAENWLSRLIQSETNSNEIVLKYAEVLKLSGKYQQAKEQYQAYLRKNGDNLAIQRAIQGADSAMVWMQNPTSHKLVNESKVNTAYAEFAVFPLTNGVFYVAEPNSLIKERSKMTGNSYLRVYTADRSGKGLLSLPTILQEKFNDVAYHIGPLAANEQGTQYFITRTYVGKDGEKLSSEGFKWRKQNLELKIYSKKENHWNEQDFAYNNPSKYSVGHASLSADGKILYFASDMPGGFGGVDLWFCEYLGDDKWGTPQNLGKTVNTEGDEMFPNVVGNSLFFSSTGHIGMGGMDIFKTVGEKTSFTSPQNMRFPINSASDDFSFTIAEVDRDDNEAGYLSSDRRGGVGSDDIYSYQYLAPQFKVFLEVVGQDKAFGNLLSNVQVTIQDPTHNNIIAKGVTDDKGVAKFILDDNEQYEILNEREDYLSTLLKISIPKVLKDTLIRIQANLQPVLKMGTTFVLEDIFYDLDKADIRPDAAIILDRLVSTMRDNPDLKIELSSHTDSRGSDSYNQKLSQRRASSAVNYIVSRGIDAGRLVAKGYGEKRLINACANDVKCTEEQHQANRRTEVLVLENK